MRYTFSFIFSSNNPNAPDHWFAKIANRPGLYEEIKTINFSQICPNCHKKNNNQISCEHIRLKTSRLKGNVSELGKLGDLLATELGGIENGAGNSAFSRGQVSKIFKEDYIVKFDIKQVQYFLLCCDPSYSGFNKTAITIGYMDKFDNHILCWLSSYSPNDYEEYLKLIYNTIVTFRKNYDSNKDIYVVYETGSRWDPSDLDNRFKTLSKENAYFSNITFIVDAYKKQKKEESRQKVPGIMATRSRLDYMVSFFARGLNQDKIYFSNKFGVYSLIETNINKEKEILLDELLNFRHFVEDSNSKYQVDKKRLKNNSGKSYGKNDDGAIVFMMLVYWGEQLRYSLEYQRQTKN